MKHPAYPSHLFDESATPLSVGLTRGCGEGGEAAGRGGGRHSL